MLYLIWYLPAVLVVGLIASGRAGILRAAVVGTIVALVVALLTAPQTFRPTEAGLALARGAWIGWIVLPYILGGLFFWQLAVKAGTTRFPSQGRTMTGQNAGSSLPPVFSSARLPNRSPASAWESSAP